MRQYLVGNGNQHNTAKIFGEHGGEDLSIRRRHKFGTPCKKKNYRKKKCVLLITKSIKDEDKEKGGREEKKCNLKTMSRTRKKNQNRVADTRYRTGRSEGVARRNT